MELPWTEKYRPKTLSEVVGQKEIVKRLKAYVKEGNFPDMIFAGPAGVGKTSCALAFARDLFGDLSGSFMELNASDERRINDIRTKVKDFAKTLPISGKNLKIIFLDEADALTVDAQHALRRIIEMFSGQTRFILSVNYSSKIIEPIQSRCTIFRFKPLSKEEITEMIMRIAKNENLSIEKEAIDALIYISEGDMRKAINLLQSAAMESKKISEKLIYSISSFARPKEVREMLNKAINGEFSKAREILDKLLFDYGLSGEDIIIQAYKEILNSKIEEKKKALLLDVLGEFNFRIVEGANERIQLEAMIAKISLLGG
ncbi:MAG: replication factor C small subunit [Candidatus Micrarchaeia archaeon]|jgi:replication factor C small subunit